MKNLIWLICFLVISSCGTIQNLNKNSSKSKLDSTYIKATDSSFISKNNGLIDSTGVSNWQKETIIEYYDDFVLPNSTNLIRDTIMIKLGRIHNLNNSKIKRIIIRQKGKDSTRLIVSKNVEGNSKVSKIDKGEAKKSEVISSVKKVVTKKPIWPYVLLILSILAACAYLYFKKINPLSLIKKLFN